MHVIATAGHVDHGKSTLVRALTGIEPDRWAEERERGMTIDLGFAWTSLASGRRVAFVDVPGHSRFVSNMLAGVGPVPAVMFVVAADQGWQAQSQEHWEAISALGVRHGLLVVTRSDLFDPGPALEEARERIGWPSVVVSGATGEGLGTLRDALDDLTGSLPEPDTAAPVRLWIDRAFTIKGAGTVVTGTLPAGTVTTGDELVLGDRRVRVRGLQTLGEPAERVAATARLAVNLRGVDPGTVHRGMALLTPSAWISTDVVDIRLAPAAGSVEGGVWPSPATAASVEGAGGDGVRLAPPRSERPPREAMLHIGSAATAVRIRAFDHDTARLTLSEPLPLRIGDQGLLRSSGRPIMGLTVLDVRPPALRRRGAAVRRAAELAEPGIPDAARLLRWHGPLRRTDVVAMGCAPGGVSVGEWLVDPDHWAELRTRLGEVVSARPGIPVEAARDALGLPARSLIEGLAEEAGLPVAGGRIGGLDLTGAVAEAVGRLAQELAAQPYRAPDGNRLAELGLTAKAVGAAVRAGALLRVADGIVLMPGADTEAARRLAELPQPFTAADARNALDTTRRVVIPLLEHLDRLGLTRRVDDRHRTITSAEVRRRE